MGDAQRLSPEEQIALAREQFESATDLTVAVEEEFAVLDPETLDLTNRFEELQAGAQGTPLEEHLVGELIASEVEIRTGRCDSFDEVAARLGERRAQLFELADQDLKVFVAGPIHEPEPFAQFAGLACRRSAQGLDGQHARA